MIQTASSALSSLTSSLQRIRQLAVQASTGSLSSSDQAALQKEVSAQIAEVNRIASQTTYNGTNILDGSAGSVTFQVGANVGQTISLDLSQSMSAAKIGGGLVQTGQTVGSFTVSLASTGTYTSTGATITSVNVLSDGKGGYTFTDQNNQAISSGAVTNIFSAGTGAGSGTAITNLTLNGTLATAMGATASGVAAAAIAQINAINNPPTVSGLDISTVTGANEAMVSIDNALQTVNTLQAALGAAQNRFTAISTSQQAESTDLSSAQSQITDANFAQETANLSKAQVLQQAGISVLAQANSNPQQVLKLLQ
jgi:flagellin